MKRRVNLEVASRLDEVARLLDEQGANSFRVDAYLNAARTLRNLERPITEIVKEQGIEGLRQLPGIGETLSRLIHQLVISGRLPMLERLRGESDPAALLASVPGIGGKLAERLHDVLGIETLEELEAAAYDGRLANVAGFGTKRIAGIRDTLATRLARVRERPSNAPADRPSVAEILDVDSEYRTKAAKGELPKIAPRRFNPGRRPWLSVLHTSRDDRHYTALFSNTSRAHEMGRTGDWVVVYYDGGNGESQCTVITAQRGPLEGRRIVRGRESECAEHYLRRSSASAGPRS
jgi:Holliday junction resolvasome RuvABC DNA-binding subunit